MSCGHSSKKHPQIDELCKYSHLKTPTSRIWGSRERITEFSKFLAENEVYVNKFYDFCTDTQRKMVILNYRFMKYLQHEFPCGGKDLVPKSDEYDTNFAMKQRDIGWKIAREYLKAHNFMNNPSGLCCCPPDIKYNSDDKSWFDIPDITAQEILEKNYYTREKNTDKTYFEIVYDRFLLTFLYDDYTYRRPMLGRKGDEYEEPVFSINSTGLKDYDVQAARDKGPVP